MFRWRTWLWKKRITTSITYEFPIKDFDCAKAFLSEIHELSQRLGKSEYWALKATSLINSGLKVVFVHLWNTKDQWFDGVHYEEEMVFEAFIGFNEIGMTLYSMGEFSVKDIESLVEKYEKNPDFIFTQLDWDAPKESIINDFISELKEYDYIEEN